MAVPTVVEGSVGSLPYLKDGALSEFFESGVYFCQSTITDLPEGVVKGVVTIRTAITSGSQHDLTQYSMSSLVDYRDNFLSEYEAFIYPQETDPLRRAFSGWRKIEKRVY